MRQLWYALDNPGRLARTVRHLRASQIFYRLKRSLPAASIASRRAPALREAQSTWTSVPGRPSSMLSTNRFRFVGETGELQTVADWNRASAPKLWLYNLHYFDDLRAHDAGSRANWHRDLIKRWIAENPPGSGNGWEPYPTSLRVVNWITWSLAGGKLDEVARDSLATQVRALGSSLEYHLLGNHLLANAKALVFAGCYFTGPEAEAWLTAGLNLLQRELAEQILADGGHFERSPMYHAIILEDVLDLVQLARIFPDCDDLPDRSQSWRRLAERMIVWMAAMSHPDGEISFFNDAAFGIARTRAELAEYAASLGISPVVDALGMRHLPESGYVRLQSGAFTVIFDIAEIGPSYLPGHGHADTLSFEASLGAQRLITNGGTSTYDDGALREQERSTAAHATVEIGSENSSEVWASFRVGRRAHPFDAVVSAEEGILSAAAGHDGYRWLAGKPVHRRRLGVSAEGLRVADSIEGRGEHSVIGRFPLHPSVSPSRTTCGWRLELADGSVLRVEIKGPVELALEERPFAPTFNQRLPRPVLIWRYFGSLPLTVETAFEFERADIARHR